MNNLEKKSFYSFLALYLFSSLFFVLLSGYLYFIAQKNSLENATYYKLQHIADDVASHIIHAQMSESELQLPISEEHYNYTLIQSSQNQSFAQNYFEENGSKVVVSTAPQKHLGIEYVVVKTDLYHKELKRLQKQILFVMSALFLLIVLISWLLSKLFMRPIHEKVSQIEQFIQDISHELNTPITALQMSAQRAIHKKVYDEKILTNISISTKQLYNIYRSLTYLSFHIEEEKAKLINIKSILMQSIAYYAELTAAKNITVAADIQESLLTITQTKAELLFSNLLSNAIKYSLPHKTIKIILREHYFSIEDEGIGIDKKKIDTIFGLYQRASNLAGGFGVGLSIVKQICDEHNISIKVNSTLEEYSRFTLRW
ncbi:MAG: two-component sensor histidine kinase [Sulfurimonas sp. GWF2_37_8]|nr:MAG: two-component sensor histidine kinase [Sulfurimonas sp. GWF2_37_8]